MQHANECYKVAIVTSVYSNSEKESSPKARDLKEAAMKLFLSSILVLTACLTICHASHNSKSQKKNAALKELAAALAKEEVNAKEASLSFKQQDDDEDTPQKQQEEDGNSVRAQQDGDDSVQEEEDKDIKLLNQQLHEYLLKEQQDDDSITNVQQEDDGDGNNAIATYEESEESSEQDEDLKDIAMAEKSQDDSGEDSLCVFFWNW